MREMTAAVDAVRKHKYRVFLRPGEPPFTGRIASRAGSIEFPHRCVQTAEGGIEVGAGLLKRGMAEHVPYVVTGQPPSTHRDPASWRRSWKCKLIAR